MLAFGFLVPRRKTFGVAVSGGSDSMALLHLAAQYSGQSGTTCLAVTVDHGLRPEAAAEARFVARACAALGVSHATLKWRRTGDGPVSQDEARRARHRLLAQWAQKQSVERLALGHTRDDRLETFLMRARQGSGWYGLPGLMPESYSPVWPEGRGLPLIRPLLAFGREELREEMRARGADWIEDPSNEASRFERVRMRRLLARMDRMARDKAVRVMDGLLRVRLAVIAEAADLLEQAHLDETGHELGLPLAARDGASAEAWRRLVEACVMAAGGSEHPPRRDALDRLLERIAQGAPGLAGGVTLGGSKIRIRKGAMLGFSQAPPRRGAPSPLRDWDRARTLLHPSSLHSLAV